MNRNDILNILIQHNSTAEFAVINDDDSEDTFRIKFSERTYFNYVTVVYHYSKRLLTVSTHNYIKHLKRPDRILTLYRGLCDSSTKFSTIIDDCAVNFQDDVPFRGIIEVPPESIIKEPLRFQFSTR